MFCLVVEAEERLLQYLENVGFPDEHIYSVAMANV